MKKFLLLLVIVFTISSCVYETVNKDTSIPKEAVDYSTHLRDSSNGLYLYRGEDNHFLFRKDSTSVVLIEKYSTENSNLDLGPLGVFALLVIFIIVGMILRMFFE